MAADKPIIIHTRKRERRAFELLQELGAKRVNWHCYGGKLKLCAHYRRARALAFPFCERATFRDVHAACCRHFRVRSCCWRPTAPISRPSRARPVSLRDVACTAAYAAELWQCTPAEVMDQNAAELPHAFPDGLIAARLARNERPAACSQSLGRARARARTRSGRSRSPASWAQYATPLAGSRRVRASGTRTGSFGC